MEKTCSCSECCLDYKLKKVAKWVTEEFKKRGWVGGRDIRERLELEGVPPTIIRYLDFDEFVERDDLDEEDDKEYIE